MKIFTKLLAVLTLALLPFLTACQEDGTAGNNTPPTPSTEQADTFQVIPLTFDRFFTPGDVLVSADTSYITVSKIYLEKLGYQVKDSDRIVVWRANNELPFVKKVRGMSSISDNRYKIDLDYACYDDVFPGGKYTFDTSYYLNTSVNPRTNEGGINEEYYAEKISDDSTVLHPVAVFKTPGQDDRVNSSDIDGVTADIELPPCTMMEDLPKYNFDWKITIFSIKFSSFNWYKDLVGDSTSFFNIGFGAKKVEVNAKAGLRFTVDGTWEKTKFVGELNRSTYKLNDFYLGAYGSLNIEADPQFNVRGVYKLSKKEKEKWTVTLFQLPSLTSVFWVGVVPVTISSTPRIILRAEPTIDGRISAGTTIKLGGEFNAGIQWRKGEGTRGVFAVTNTQFKFDPYVQMEGTASMKVGAYLAAYVKLWGLAGPEMLIGPSVTAKASGNVGFYPMRDPMFNYGGKLQVDYAVGGTVGGKMEFARVKIASVSTGFDIFSGTLFSWPK